MTNHIVCAAAAKTDTEYYSKRRPATDKSFERWSGHRTNRSAAYETYLEARGGWCPSANHDL